MGLRMIAFLGMLTVISFAVIFAAATETQGVFLGAAAIPNASFVAGLIFSVVVFTPTPEDDERGAGRLGALMDRVRELRESGGSSSDSSRQATKRDPFADD